MNQRNKNKKQNGTHVLRSTPNHDTSVSDLDVQHKIQIEPSKLSDRGPNIWEKPRSWAIDAEFGTRQCAEEKWKSLNYQENMKDRTRESRSSDRKWKKERERRKRRMDTIEAFLEEDLGGSDRQKGEKNERAKVRVTHPKRHYYQRWKENERERERATWNWVSFRFYIAALPALLCLFQCSG